MSAQAADPELDPLEPIGAGVLDLSHMSNFIHLPKIAPVTDNSSSSSSAAPKTRWWLKKVSQPTSHSRQHSLSNSQLSQSQPNTHRDVGAPLPVIDTSHAHTHRAHTTSTDDVDESPLPASVPKSAWALGGTAAVPVASPVTKKKYKSDKARAKAWKKAQFEAELAQLSRGKPSASSGSRHQLDFDEEKFKDFDDEPDHWSPPPTPPVDSEDHYTREVVRFLRPASRGTEVVAEGSTGTVKARPASVSLNALLIRTPISTIPQSAKDKKEPDSAKSRNSSRNSSRNTSRVQMRPESKSGYNSGRTTPRAANSESASRAGMRKGPPGGRRKPSFGGESPSSSKSSSRAHSPTGNTSTKVGRLDVVDDDDLTEDANAEAQKTSAYYSIILSVTKRIQEYVEALEPDDDIELKNEWRRQGLSESDIEARVKRRHQIATNTMHQLQIQQQNAMAQLAKENQNVNNLASPISAAASFSFFIPQNSVSAATAAAAAGLPPSQYDRYRDTFQTVSSLVESMARNDKEKLFADVAEFFADKKKTEQSEAKKLQAIESENMEGEEAVEQSKKSITATIQAKELNTIKLLNSYYTSLRKSHRKHIMTQKALSSSRSASTTALDSNESMVKLLRSGDIFAPNGALRSPLGLNRDIDFMSLADAEEEDLLTETYSHVEANLRSPNNAAAAGDAAQGADNSQSSDARASSLLSPTASSASLLSRISSLSNLNGAAVTSPSSSKALLQHSSSASTVSATEAMEVLQEKLSGYGGEEAHQLKLELLISMLYAKLAEQNAVLQSHTILTARKKNFEEKVAQLLRTVNERQQSITNEIEDRKRLLAESSLSEDRLQHLLHFESQEAMMASVNTERAVVQRAREEKQEAFLASLRGDQSAVEDHAKEAERLTSELTTRLKRMEAELVHMQKLREQDRLKNKMVERKMKKEIILVLNGQIPPSLQKELAAEQEQQAHDKRALDRMDRSEAIRVDSAATVKSKEEEKVKELEGSDASSNESDDEATTERLDRKESATSVRPSISRKGTAQHRPRSTANGHRPSSTASHQSRASRVLPNPISPPVQSFIAPPTNSIDTPLALVELRQGMRDLETHKAALHTLMELATKEMDEMGIPLLDQLGEEERQVRKLNAASVAMEGVQEGEETEDDAAKPADQVEEQAAHSTTADVKSPHNSKKQGKRKLSVKVDSDSHAPKPKNSSELRKKGPVLHEKGGEIRMRRRSIPDAGEDAANASHVSSPRVPKSHQGSPRVTQLKTPKSKKASPATSHRASIARQKSDVIHASKETSPVHKPRELNKKKDNLSIESNPPSPRRKLAAPHADSANANTNPDAASVPVMNTAELATLAAEASRDRRLSFESRYAALLSSPDAVVLARASSDDDEAVIEEDAHGRVTGAYTRKELRAQAARFKALIVELTTQRKQMSEELVKLEAVHTKLPLAEAHVEQQKRVYTTLEETLSDLMSQVRALHLEANAHGLVIGDDMTPDDLAEHAIWVEDGFKGEAQIPSLPFEDGWTTELQVQIDKEETQRKQEERQRAHELEEEKDRQERDAAIAVVPAEDTGVPSVEGSPTAAGTPSYLNDAMATLAREQAEDAEDELEETRMAKYVWEENKREEFEEQLRAPTTLKAARFVSKIQKLQIQLADVRGSKSADAEMIREKIEKLQSKVTGIIKAKDAEIDTMIRAEEVEWQQMWDARKNDRQSKRKEARIEAARLEAIAVRAEANRLKREKRAQSNSERTSAVHARRQTVFALRRQQLLTDSLGIDSATTAPGLLSSGTTAAAGGLSAISDVTTPVAPTVASQTAATSKQKKAGDKSARSSNRASHGAPGVSKSMARLSLEKKSSEKQLPKAHDKPADKTRHAETAKHRDHSKEVEHDKEKDKKPVKVKDVRLEDKKQPPSNSSVSNSGTSSVSMSKSASAANIIADKPSIDASNNLAPLRVETDLSTEPSPVNATVSTAAAAEQSDQASAVAAAQSSSTALALQAAQDRLLASKQELAARLESMKAKVRAEKQRKQHIKSLTPAQREEFFKMEDNKKLKVAYQTAMEEAAKWKLLSQGHALPPKTVSVTENQSGPVVSQPLIIDTIRNKQGTVPGSKVASSSPMPKAVVATSSTPAAQPSAPAATTDDSNAPVLNDSQVDSTIDQLDVSRDTSGSHTPASPTHTSMLMDQLSRERHVRSIGSFDQLLQLQASAEATALSQSASSASLTPSASTPSNDPLLYARENTVRRQQAAAATRAQEFSVMGSSTKFSASKQLAATVNVKQRDDKIHAIDSQAARTHSDSHRAAESKPPSHPSAASPKKPLASARPSISIASAPGSSLLRLQKTQSESHNLIKSMADAASAGESFIVANRSAGAVHHASNASRTLVPSSHSPPSTDQRPISSSDNEINRTINGTGTITQGLQNPSSLQTGKTRSESRPLVSVSPPSSSFTPHTTVPTLKTINFSSMLLESNSTPRLLLQSYDDSAPVLQAIGLNISPRNSYRPISAGEVRSPNQSPRHAQSNAALGLTIKSHHVPHHRSVTSNPLGDILIHSLAASLIAANTASSSPVAVSSIHPTYGSGASSNTSSVVHSKSPSRRPSGIPSKHAAAAAVAASADHLSHGLKTGNRLHSDSKISPRLASNPKPALDVSQLPLPPAASINASTPRALAHSMLPSVAIDDASRNTPTSRDGPSANQVLTEMLRQQLADDTKSTSLGQPLSVTSPIVSPSGNRTTPGSTNVRPRKMSLSPSRNRPHPVDPDAPLMLVAAGVPYATSGSPQILTRIPIQFGDSPVDQESVHASSNAQAQVPLALELTGTSSFAQQTPSTSTAIVDAADARTALESQSSATVTGESAMPLFISNSRAANN